MRACANCGASIADDQRYCLECGVRQVQARSEFLTRFTPAALGPGLQAAGAQASPAANGRSTNATTIAGVGVLLLAMGVGVLIGRAGGGKTATAPAQVISVASSGAATTGAPAAGGGGASGAGATEVPEDWTAGKIGYTVQLQTFSTSSAQASEVTAAKSGAQSKGATGVGILLSSNFTSLPADQYVIYSGDDSSEGQAKQALASLKAKFPAAAVIHVSGGSSVSAGAGAGSSSSKASGDGSSGSPKAGGGSTKSPTAAPKSSAPSSGQSYEQKSRNLPNVVLTG